MNVQSDVGSGWPVQPAKISVASVVRFDQNEGSSGRLMRPSLWELHNR
jgi:hypothetical protein